MELSFIGPEDAEGFSAFLHPLWVGTHAPIINGGKEWAEVVFPRWGGVDRIKGDLSKGHFYAYIMDDGKRIGALSYGAEGERLIVGRLYLLPDYRGKGLGTECLEHILAYGRGNGCKIAELCVNPKNENAISLYSKYGFRETSRKQNERGYTSVMTAEL